MEFNSELEIRQEIMIRLETVYEVLDGLISLARERNYNWREGHGYQLSINKNDFKEIKNNFESFFNLRLLLTRDNTSNYDDWLKLTTIVFSLVGLFKESKILFITLYETTSGEISRLKQQIKEFVIDHKLDAVKNSTQFKVVKEKLTLKEQCEIALKENDIYIGEDFEDLDFTGKKDFIVFTFISAKYEIAVNGINEEFAEFIKSNPDKIPHLDDMGWMLEMMRDDEEITQDQFDEFEAYFEDIISLVEDVEELKITTKNHESFVIKESDLQTTPFETDTIGEVIDSRLEGMDYYYLVLTGAPAYHSGIILLDAEVTKEDIVQKLTLIQLEGFSVGFKYEDEEEYWDKGEQIKQKYVDANLLPVDEISGKTLNELFK